MTNSIPAVPSTAASFLTTNQVSPTQAGGGAYIRFDAKRTGQWLFGPEAEPVTGDVFSLDVLSLKHGMIQWHQKKADRLMVPINQALPAAQEPIHWTDNKGKPQVSEANEARAFEGTFEDGTKFQYEASTFGGRKATDALLAEVFMRANAGNGFVHPQVELNTNSYEHSSYGKVFEPVLTAVAWFNDAGEAEPDGAAQIGQDDTAASQDDEVAAPEPAPAKRTRSRAK